MLGRALADNSRVSERETQSPPPGPVLDRLEAGTLVDGRYRILRELGQGGMGAVYVAEDIALERRVAIKLARTELPWALSRFRREAAALAAIPIRP